MEEDITTQHIHNTTKEEKEQLTDDAQAIIDLFGKRYPFFDYKEFNRMVNSLIRTILILTTTVIPKDKQDEFIYNIYMTLKGNLKGQEQ